jgi:hypothetical protein
VFGKHAFVGQAPSKMSSVTSVLNGIHAGTFPSGNTLNACKKETKHAFELLSDAYFQFILLHTLDETQSRLLVKFFQEFYKEIGYPYHAGFINTMFLRLDVSSLKKFVRLISGKTPSRRSAYLKAIALTAEAPFVNVEVIEELILLAFEDFHEDEDQKAIIDFLALTLPPADFLTAMIFCRDQIGNKNYLELCCWSCLHNVDFLPNASIERLRLILPRLQFQTISDLSILNDLSKQFRFFLSEISRAREMMTAVESVARKRIEYLYKPPGEMPPDIHDDLTKFYENYKYGVK